jgi:hypothetical protein
MIRVESVLGRPQPTAGGRIKADTVGIKCAPTPEYSSFVGPCGVELERRHGPTAGAGTSSAAMQLTALAK